MTQQTMNANDADISEESQRELALGDLKQSAQRELAAGEHRPFVVRIGIPIDASEGLDLSTRINGTAGGATGLVNTPASNSRTNACERMCCPVCCCM